MNETTSPQPSGFRAKLLRFHWLYTLVPVMSVAPGFFLMWITCGPVAHSHKFTTAEVMTLGFIAAGITLMGVLLGAILAYIGLLVSKLEKANKNVPANPIPSTSPVQQGSRLLITTLAAIALFLAGFGVGTAWALHCVYGIKASEAESVRASQQISTPSPQLPSH